MKRILVVEDEDAIRDFVIINLKRVGYEVEDASSGEEALEIFSRDTTAFDAALLDIMMPGIDGFAVCKEMRRKNSTMGIIMLSAKSQEMDKVNGLMLGADDYITKPFSPSELLARVDAICRRVSLSAPGKEQSDEIQSGIFTLNLKSRTLTKNGVPIDLTQVEFLIMELFLQNPDTAMERSEILKKVWGEGYYGDVKIVDVNIRRLRMKIEDEPSSPKHLLTVWGYGYKWAAGQS